jgi:hypothetical protein
MDDMNHSLRCSDCGCSLPGGERLPCPNCGSTKRAISESICLNAHASVSVGWERRREFYESNRTALVVVVAVSLLSPLLGFFIVGITGVLVGLLLACVSYLLGPHATTRVREITKGS